MKPLKSEKSNVGNCFLPVHGPTVRPSRKIALLTRRTPDLSIITHRCLIHSPSFAVSLNASFLLSLVPMHSMSSFHDSIMC